MIKIVDKQDTGKTKRLLQICGENDGIYICKHPAAVTEKCIAYGLPVVAAEGYWYLSNPLIKNETRPIYIDDIDRYLEYLSDNIGGVSFTID